MWQCVNGLYLLQSTLPSHGHWLPNESSPHQNITLQYIIS